MSYKVSYNNGDVYRVEKHNTFEDARKSVLDIVDGINYTIEEDNGNEILLLSHYCGAISWFEATITQD